MYEAFADEAAQRTGSVENIGVSEEEEFGAGFRGGFRALIERPDFAGPTFRQRRAADDGQFVLRAHALRDVTRDLGGVVGGTGVDKEKRILLGVILFQQRRQRAG